MTNQKHVLLARLAIWSSAIFVALAVLDVALSVVESWPDPKRRTVSIHDAWNNPGKHYFHLVLLPLVTGLFIRNFPGDEVLSVRRRLMGKGVRWWLLFWGPAWVLPVIAIVLVTMHDLDKFRTGAIPPDFALNPEIKKRLWSARIGSEQGLRRMPIVGGSLLAVGSTSYQARANDELQKRKEGRQSLKLGSLSLVDWLAFKSPRAHVSYLESIIAAIVGAMVLWTLWVFWFGLWLSRRHGFDLVRIRHETAHAIFIFLLAVLAWTFLTVYSNWYDNFCVPGNYHSAIPNALLWLGLAGLVMDRVSPSGDFLKNVGTWIGLLLFGIVFETGDKGFTSLAAWYHGQEVFVQVSMAIATSLGVVVFAFSPCESGCAQAPDENALEKSLG